MIKKKGTSVPTIIIVFVSVYLSACGMLNTNDFSKPLTIEDIAYDGKGKSDYTVYIKENSEYIPYIVLTGDYYGNTLLLRKDLLRDPHKYGYGHYFGESTSVNNNHNDSAYYATSNIDKFLNDKFINHFSKTIRKNIVDTKIIITSENRVKNNGLFLMEGTETISRKVFLLSYTELALPRAETANIEGEALEYFKKHSIIAYREAKPSSYWLRSRYTLVDNLAWGVSAKGTYGGGDTKSSNGVRPAFCLKNTVRIRKSDSVIDGKEAYVISQ